MDSSSKRTLVDIILGCVSTTIICAWTAVHPNIPPRERILKGAFRRLELMFWIIVAPELLPCWAMNQLLAAMTVRDAYNEGKGYTTQSLGLKKRLVSDGTWKTMKGLLYGTWVTVRGWLSWYEILDDEKQEWTLVHGYFLIMGGFHLIEPVEEKEQAEVPAMNTTLIEIAGDEESGPAAEHKLEKGRVTILSLEVLRELLKDPEFKIQISEDEIMDKSKGDALSKFIVILQSSWFITHCIARHIQGLEFSQLELTTLALASLNGITILLWWYKPLGVKYPVRVHLKHKMTDEVRNKGRVQDLELTMPNIADDSVYMMSTGSSSRWRALTFANMWIADASSRWRPRDWVCTILFFPLIISIILFFWILTIPVTTLNDILGNTTFPADATYVPTFYVPKHRYSDMWHILLFSILGSAFGGIHCIGWNFHFPTAKQQYNWRLASVAVTSLPVGFILLRLFRRSCFRDPEEGFKSHFIMLLYSVVICGAVRLVLLGQSVLLLKSLSPSAFIAVDWTKFYPHVLGR